MKIQIETKEDFEVVYEVVQTAFKNAEHSDGNEADLVVALRNSLAFVPELSLVAKIQDKVVGHLLLTEISIGENVGLALAPLAVLPDFQKQGVGSALIKKAHEVAEKLGYPAIVVLGDPNYYSKFGYEEASQWQIQAPFDIPSEYFRVCFLKQQGEKPVGLVTYAPEFGIV